MLWTPCLLLLLFVCCCLFVCLMSHRNKPVSQSCTEHLSAAPKRGLASLRRKRAIPCVLSTNIHFFHTICHVYRWPAREAKPRFGATLVCSAHDCETDLLVMFSSLAGGEVLDWHRFGNTGGLRAESETEKALKAILSFIKSHSECLRFLLLQSASLGRQHEASAIS